PAIGSEEGKGSAAASAAAGAGCGCAASVGAVCGPASDAGAAGSGADCTASLSAAGCAAIGAVDGVCSATAAAATFGSPDGALLALALLALSRSRSLFALTSELRASVVVALASTIAGIGREGSASGVAGATAPAGAVIDVVAAIGRAVGTVGCAT